jgi:hypothetical protein
LAPTIYAKLYGPEGGIRVYSVGFSFIGIASFINIFMMEVMLSIIGFGGICYVYGIFSVMALIILIVVFREEKVKL